LHVSAPSTSGAPPQPKPAGNSPLRTAHHDVTATPATNAARGTSHATALTRERTFTASPTGDERRTRPGELARRIERALVRAEAAHPVRPTTIAIKAGDGRVQLLVRTDGPATRIVALCAPHLRERVDRALAAARFALAATGRRVEVAP
jgi:hypothetical protein